MIKGCDGYTNKIDGKDFNMFVDGTNVKLKDASESLRIEVDLNKEKGCTELVSVLLSNAVCNNKKVEMEVDEKLEQIKKVSLLG